MHPNQNPQTVAHRTYRFVTDFTYMKNIVEKACLILIASFLLTPAKAWVGGATSRLHVEGRYLKDVHGNSVNLHGVALTPSPWFNGCGSGNCRWENYDVTGCLNYNNSVMDALTDTTRGWYLNYIRLHIDPYWTNNPGQPVNGESDISQFNYDRLKTAITDVIVPLIKHAKARGMYVILRPPGVCPEKIEVGGAYHNYLLRVWGYLSTRIELKNADNVMFELANEPVQIKGTDGTYGSGSQGHFDQLKTLFQSVVDTIRANGAQNVLWIPGLGWQSQYRGYAINPIEGENIGYAVHIYPGFLNGGPDYDAFKRGWNENVKPVADFAPIAITEVDWSPQVGLDASGKAYNMGTWGTGNTGTAEAPGFGFNFKRIMDESGNVSWNLLAPEGLIANGEPGAGIAFNSNPEACAYACNNWFREYSRINYARPNFTYRSTGDNNNGTYSNPVIFGDFPDPDVIRVGDVYYMLSTTMHHFPGATLLKSYDLVNWEYCSNPLQKIESTPPYNLDGANRYSHGQWASALGYKNGTFYLLFNTLDEGAYLMTATDPAGEWTKRKLNDSFYDCGLLFDDNGKTYVVYGIDNIRIAELDENFAKVPGKDQQVFTYTFRKGLEGSHLYKINGYYYIYSTYGGWPAFQVALRSSSIFGPYEEHVVINDDNIHQGALVQTQTGEWWSMMFYDKGAYGRLPNLQPITWVDNWPVAGVSGKGVTAYRKPKVGKTYPISYMPTNDNFRNYKLAPQWQWNHNPDNTNWSLINRPGYLRLYTAHVTDSLPKARNTLTQRILGYRNSLNLSYGTAKLHVSKMAEGDVAGLAVFQDPYAFIAVKVINGERKLYMLNAGTKTEQTGVTLADTVVYLRAITNYLTSKADFYYSTDNKTYTAFGSSLDMKYNLSVFVGNRFCLFNYATVSTGGYVDVDWFSTEKDFTENRFYDDSFVGFSREALTLKELKTDKTSISLLTGSSQSLTVTAVYEDGHTQDVTMNANYVISNPDVVSIKNGQLVGKTNGESTITVTFQGGLGEPMSLPIQVSSSFFPLVKGVFNPSIFMSGTYNESTRTLVTGQYGFGGWTYNNGVDFSGYKYLVVRLASATTSGAIFKLYDENSYWTTPSENSFDSNRRVVVSLNNSYKVNSTTKLNPSHIYIAGFWSWGGSPIVISDIYLTNNSDYSKPTSIGDVQTDPEDENAWVDVYTITGIRIKTHVRMKDAASGLNSGIYLIGKKKMLVSNSF